MQASRVSSRAIKHLASSTQAKSLRTTASTARAFTTAILPSKRPGPSMTSTSDRNSQTFHTSNSLLNSLDWDPDSKVDPIGVPSAPAVVPKLREAPTVAKTEAEFVPTIYAVDGDSSRIAGPHDQL
ncbi:uncharacterized protein EI97DRAFT_461283 [Westerdykella ornata]|uniref:Uncharacterized protein n=1 Tax=Westerdykella ornata TaxID=318751 RepID=A0A6A6JDE5_WESOR|nr:uncharacterized protein EI97DRAFT_461283 [Westerdykella ornata]KAF2273209.1 hypothetical protein EI97DRAFT_461283 [Westerdykella ornata]